MATVDRQAPDLSEYPDLVVIYLGMRVRRWYGIKTLLGFGPRIQRAVGEQPDGLLLHENVLWSLFPPHAGMRQYWRDFDALERWTRSDPHKAWWQAYLRDSGGTTFWHETYFMSGGMEGVFEDLDAPVGLATFAPMRPARAGMFSARGRAHLPDAEGRPAPPLPEAALYGPDEPA